MLQHIPSNVWFSSLFHHWFKLWSVIPEGCVGYILRGPQRHSQCTSAKNRLKCIPLKKFVSCLWGFENLSVSQRDSNTIFASLMLILTYNSEKNPKLQHNNNWYPLPISVDIMTCRSFNLFHELDRDALIFHPTNAKHICTDTLPHRGHL